MAATVRISKAPPAMTCRPKAAKADAVSAASAAASHTAQRRDLSDPVDPTGTARGHAPDQLQRVPG